MFGANPSTVKIFGFVQLGKKQVCRESHQCCISSSQGYSEQIVTLVYVRLLAVSLQFSNRLLRAIKYECSEATLYALDSGA